MQCLSTSLIFFFSRDFSVSIRNENNTLALNIETRTSVKLIYLGFSTVKEFSSIKMQLQAVCFNAETFFVLIQTD